MKVRRFPDCLAKDTDKVEVSARQELKEQASKWPRSTSRMRPTPKGCGALDPPAPAPSSSPTSPRARSTSTRSGQRGCRLPGGHQAGAPPSSTRGACASKTACHGCSRIHPEYHGAAPMLRADRQPRPAEHVNERRSGVCNKGLVPSKGSCTGSGATC